MIVTTTNNVDGRPILDYKGVVFGEVITGINMFRDIGAGIRNIFGGSINYAPLADFTLLRQAYEQSVKQGIPARVGNIVSVDRFYDDEIDNDKLTQYGIMAVEMETAGLYTLAAKYGAQALGLFTVSDHLLTGEACTPEERQTSFDDMIHIALETAIQE